MDHDPSIDLTTTHEDLCLATHKRNQLFYLIFVQARLLIQINTTVQNTLLFFFGLLAARTITLGQPLRTYYYRPQ